MRNKLIYSLEVQKILLSSFKNAKEAFHKTFSEYHILFELFLGVQKSSLLIEYCLSQEGFSLSEVHIDLLIRSRDLECVQSDGQESIPDISSACSKMLDHAEDIYVSY